MNAALCGWQWRPVEAEGRLKGYRRRCVRFMGHRGICKSAAYLRGLKAEYPGSRLKTLRYPRVLRSVA